MKKSNFKIIISDYHEIKDAPEGFKYLEIGLFPSKKNPEAPDKYFRLLYNGRKPSFDRVWKRVKGLVYIGTIYKNYCGFHRKLDYTKEDTMRIIKSCLNWKE